jgi:hypothetical protein
VFRAPSAQTTRRFPSETGRLDHVLQRLRQLLAVFVADGRGEAHMVQQTLVIVKAEQQGSDKLLLSEIAKTSDHTICRALLLDLLHPGALAGLPQGSRWRSLTLNSIACNLSLLPRFPGQLCGHACICHRDGILCPLDTGI